MQEEFQYPFRAGAWSRQNSHPVLLYFWTQPWWLLLSLFTVVLCMDRKRNLMTEWMDEWTENLKTKYIFKRLFYINQNSTDNATKLHTSNFFYVLHSILIAEPSREFLESLVWQSEKYRDNMRSLLLVGKDF